VNLVGQHSKKLLEYCMVTLVAKHYPKDRWMMPLKIKTAKILIQAGAKVHAHCTSGETLLEKCLLQGHTAMAQLLVQHGASMSPTHALYSIFQESTRFFQRISLDYGDFDPNYPHDFRYSVSPPLGGDST